ncbi:hypothetical protein HanRHA438_Chr14g0651261 [Helianthus annuus]|nr:hypothetical protein HanRHA438_Chr14g0651261 [Helianthus annuus]
MEYLRTVILNLDEQVIIYAPKVICWLLMTVHGETIVRTDTGHTIFSADCVIRLLTPAIEAEEE